MFRKLYAIPSAGYVIIFSRTIIAIFFFPPSNVLQRGGTFSPIFRDFAHACVVLLLFPRHVQLFLAVPRGWLVFVFMARDFSRGLLLWMLFYLHAGGSELLSLAIIAADETLLMDSRRRY